MECVIIKSVNQNFTSGSNTFCLALDGWLDVKHWVSVISVTVRYREDLICWHLQTQFQEHFSVSLFVLSGSFWIKPWLEPIEIEYQLLNNFCWSFSNCRNNQARNTHTWPLLFVATDLLYLTEQCTVFDLLSSLLFSTGYILGRWSDPHLWSCGRDEPEQLVTAAGVPL